MKCVVVFAALVAVSLAQFTGVEEIVTEPVALVETIKKTEITKLPSSGPAEVVIEEFNKTPLETVETIEITKPGTTFEVEKPKQLFVEPPKPVPTYKPSQVPTFKPSPLPTYKPSPVSTLKPLEKSYVSTDDDRNAQLLEGTFEINPDSSFAFNEAISNGIRFKEQGSIVNYGSDVPALAVNGAFGWISKEGEEVTFVFTADKDGYKPESAALPTPPPTPLLIQRLIDYLATAAPPKSVDRFN